MALGAPLIAFKTPIYRARLATIADGVSSR
jgi:hypothetical protein